MRTYKEQTALILNKIDKYQVARKKQLKLVYSFITAAACIILIAISITIIPRIINNDRSDSLPNQDSIISSGVNIPALELPKKNSEAAMDMIGLVVYNDKIYTQVQHLICNDEIKNTLIGEYLGTAKETIDEWSSQDEYSTQFSSTIYGDVYTVNGYDKDFRLCILKIYDDGEFLEFYENLNGITLINGEDLYGKSRLNLKGNYQDVVYQLHDDWDYEQNNYKHLDDITEEDINQFVDMLYSSSFIEPSISLFSGKDIYDMNLQQAHLYFKMLDGTTVELRLFENGCVGYRGMYARVYVMIEDDIFQKIFDAAMK